MDKIVIEQTPAFKIGDEVYLTLQEAQHAGIQSIFTGSDAAKETDPSYSPETAADVVMEHRNEIIAILTGTKPRRKRSDAGKPHAKPVIRRKAAVITDPPPEDEGVTVEASSKYKGK